MKITCTNCGKALDTQIDRGVSFGNHDLVLCGACARYAVPCSTLGCDGVVVHVLEMCKTCKERGV